MSTHFDLKTIGASEDVLEYFRMYATRGLTLGRVSTVYRDQYRLYTERGEKTAEAIGALLYRAGDAAALPAVGDWAALQLIDNDTAMIHDILPRRTKFSRRAAGNREVEQVVASNIDVVLVVCGLDLDFNLRRIERYLTLALESGAEATVVLNKSDLAVDVDSRLEETRRICRGAGVVAISALKAEGIAGIASFLGGNRTIALLGSSGAGKSTLVNRLLGEQRQQVQDVRESDNRGRHTTTRRELIPLPGGGALIDTPGMRELQLWVGQESLDATFTDIAELALLCRFRDCNHTGESGCGVIEALADGRLDAARWESYRKLRAEVQWHERQTDANAARATKQRWKVIHKAMRARYKSRW
jgi:ribosome biogenesis GTPase